jgi:hypothetical protein
MREREAPVKYESNMIRESIALCVFVAATVIATSMLLANQQSETAPSNKVGQDSVTTSEPTK